LFNLRCILRTVSSLSFILPLEQLCRITFSQRSSANPPLLCPTQTPTKRTMRRTRTSKLTASLREYALERLYWTPWAGLYPQIDCGRARPLYFSGSKGMQPSFAHCAMRRLRSHILRVPICWVAGTLMMCTQPCTRHHGTFTRFLRHIFPLKRA